MSNSIYITYNPQSQQEKRLAQALYKEGLEKGFNVLFPERDVGVLLNKVTEKNIIRADWFIIFSTQVLDKTVLEEMGFAIKKGKSPDRIFVVYSNHKGKNLRGDLANKFTEFFVDDYRLDNIEKFKTDVLLKIEEKNKAIENTNKALITILGIGATALLINAFSKK